MTTKEITAFQTMQADNDTLIITDPCYLMNDEDWDEWLELENAYTNPNSLLEYLRSKHNFGELIAADTGYGDWSNEVFESDTNETIGEFTADAGMVIVCTASDLTNYGYDREKFLDLSEKGCLAVIPNYTGTITLHYDEKDGSRLAIIKGTGDFNFETMGWAD